MFLSVLMVYDMSFIMQGKSLNPLDENYTANSFLENMKAKTEGRKVDTDKLHTYINTHTHKPI